jgi:hypothetical protein
LPVRCGPLEEEGEVSVGALGQTKNACCDFRPHRPGAFWTTVLIQKIYFASHGVDPLQQGPYHWSMGFARKKTCAAWEKMEVLEGGETGKIGLAKRVASAFGLSDRVETIVSAKIVEIPYSRHLPTLLASIPTEPARCSSRAAENDLAFRAMLVVSHQQDSGTTCSSKMAGVALVLRVGLWLKIAMLFGV